MADTTHLRGDARTLEQHLASTRFRAGEEEGRWTVLLYRFPELVVEVTGADLNTRVTTSMTFQLTMLHGASIAGGTVGARARAPDRSLPVMIALRLPASLRARSPCVRFLRTSASAPHHYRARRPYRCGVLNLAATPKTTPQLVAPNASPHPTRFGFWAWVISAKPPFGR